MLASNGNTNRQSKVSMALRVDLEVSKRIPPRMSCRQKEPNSNRREKEKISHANRLVESAKKAHQPLPPNLSSPGSH